MGFSVSTMSTALNLALNDIILLLLGQISADYSIDIEELKQKYLVDKTPLNKRGRKKKTKEEYIETEEFEHDGIIYLVDSNNIVYSNNIKKPVILGNRSQDGNIVFMIDEFR